MSFSIVKTLFSPFEYEEVKLKEELCSMMNQPCERPQETL